VVSARADLRLARPNRASGATRCVIGRSRSLIRYHPIRHRHKPMRCRLVPMSSSARPDRTSGPNR
jgi:hypothetical protein